MKKSLLIVSLVILFLFTRFYNIDKSLFFYNDMGRDLMVLLQWQKTGKTPLLGPQTGALPINQSPIYYYLLLPFFFLSNQSPLSASFLITTVYLLCFAAAFWFTKSNKKLNTAILLTFLLVIFHPQYILQNRYVWNPSLLSPLTILSLFLFLINQYFWSILLISLALSIHYSAIPVLLAYLIVILFFKKKYFLKSSFFSFISVLFFNITTITQIAKRLILTGILLRPDQIYQTGSTFSQKINDLIHYALGVDVNLVTYIFFLLILVLASYASIFSKNKISRIASLIFLITLAITLATPFNLNDHYIFAITSTMFVFISILNRRISIPIILFLLIFYLQPSRFKSYFQNSPRTYQQMESCFQKFCTEFKSPVFVSVESDLFPYHFGPEDRYLMSKNGCDVKEIEKNQKATKYMVVVLDSGSYSKETKYYELDLFGKHEEVRRYFCQRNFNIVLLEKSPK